MCPQKEAAPCPERGLSSGGQASATVRPEAQPFFFFLEGVAGDGEEERCVTLRK